MRIYRTEVSSPLGLILLFSNGDALTGLSLPGQHTKDEVKGEYLVKDDLHIFKITREYLASYFKGEAPQNLPRVAFSGTSFQDLVWDELLKIPCGELLTYGELSKRVAARRGTTYMSARAVGHAVGQNPISIIIPCHRVIGAKSRLTGYGGGLPLKKELLKLEGHDLAKFKD